jgi:hypothetical protein
MMKDELREVRYFSCFRGDDVMAPGNRSLFWEDRLNHHAKQFIGSQAEFVAGDAKDARIAGAEHFDPRAASNTELFQAVDVVWLTEDAKDRSRLPGTKFLQEDSVSNHGLSLEVKVNAYFFRGGFESQSSY